MSSKDYTRPFPGVIRIEPAAACNLRCSHCPTGTIKIPRGIMRDDTFSLVLDSLRDNISSVRVAVLYHGGEPLLNKRFGEMVRRVKELGVPFVKTVSNGMLLTDKTIVDIVSNGLDSIEFSLDGQNPEENDLIRRECDYATVVQNIKRLIDCRRNRKSTTPEILVSSTQFLDQETYLSKGQEPPLPAYVMKEFSDEYAGEIAGFKCAWAMQWPHMEVEKDLYEVYHDPFDTETLNSCDHVDSTMTIRWNGDVVPCCYDLTSQHVLGNVHQKDLATIWNSRSYLGLRRSIDKMNFIPICGNCNVVKPNVYLTLKPELARRFGNSESRSP